MNKRLNMVYKAIIKIENVNLLDRKKTWGIKLRAVTITRYNLKA